jgi:hypothetical protein
VGEPHRQRLRQRVTNPAYYAKPDMADGAIPTLEGH